LNDKNNHINDLNNRIITIQQSQVDAEQQRATAMSQMNLLKQQLDREKIRCQKVEHDFMILTKENNDIKIELDCLKERESEQQIQYEGALNEIDDLRIECTNLQTLVDNTKRNEKKANKTLKELKNFINKVSVPTTPGGLTQDE
jgi:chromosome segregation ATPase